MTLSDLQQKVTFKFDVGLGLQYGHVTIYKVRELSTGRLH